MLYKVVLTFDSTGEIQKCDHSDESYWADFPVVLFIMLYKVVLTFDSSGEIQKCDHSLYESYWADFPVLLFITLYKVVLTFDSTGEIQKCDHSDESYWAVLFCGTVYERMLYWCCSANFWAAVC